jgi:hypothetical protein
VNFECPLRAGSSGGIVLACTFAGSRKAVYPVEVEVVGDGENMECSAVWRAVEVEDHAGPRGSMQFGPGVGVELVRGGVRGTSIMLFPLVCFVLSSSPRLVDDDFCSAYVGVDGLQHGADVVMLGLMLVGIVASSAVLAHSVLWGVAWVFGLWTEVWTEVWTGVWTEVVDSNVVSINMHGLVWLT